MNMSPIFARCHRRSVFPSENTRFGRSSINPSPPALEFCDSRPAVITITAE